MATDKNRVKRQIWTVFGKPDKNRPIIRNCRCNFMSMYPKNGRGSILVGVKLKIGNPGRVNKLKALKAEFGACKNDEDRVLKLKFTPSE